MITIRNYNDMLRALARDYFVSNVYYVPDLASWAMDKGVGLSEPHQLLKLLSADNKLLLFVQETVEKETLDMPIRALGLRWSLRDNRTDPERQLNSVKKKIAYCFFKEYARSIDNVGGDELLEDDWAMIEVEKAGLFKE